MQTNINIPNTVSGLKKLGRVKVTRLVKGILTIDDIPAIRDSLVRDGIAFTEDDSGFSYDNGARFCFKPVLTKLATGFITFRSNGYLFTNDDLPSKSHGDTITKDMLRPYGFAMSFDGPGEIQYHLELGADSTGVK